MMMVVVPTDIKCMLRKAPLNCDIAPCLMLTATLKKRRGKDKLQFQAASDTLKEILKQKAMSLCCCTFCLF